MDDPDNINIADLAKEYAENQIVDEKQRVPGLRKSLIAWEKIRRRRRDEEIWRRQLANVWIKNEKSK